MNVEVKFSKKQVQRLGKLAVKYNKKNMEKQLEITLNKAATKLRSATSQPVGISQQIRKKLNINAKMLKRWLNKQKRVHNMSTRVTLVSTGRVGLGAFSPRQTKKGVSYKIEKQGKRRIHPHAFGPKPKTIARLGGQPFARVPGASRLPIQKLWGISPWAFAEKNDMGPEFKRTAKKRLAMELNERIRFLKKKGWGKNALRKARGKK